jgi:iron complex outermembrane recepter protein
MGMRRGKQHGSFSLNSAVRSALRGALRPTRPDGMNALLLIGSITAASSAFAQSTDLDEIVVTATRRAATVSDIPYNISAVSDSQLTESHVTQVADLSRLVAGLSYVDTGPGNAGRNNTFTLRGVTADSTSNNGNLPAATVAPVSVYIGETPLFLPLQIDDLDRVEVLRGPQGTLYGSGSLAGTIRFIPKAPDPAAGFSGELTGDTAAMPGHGGDWNRGASGALNVPLSDTAALRFSGGYQYWGGFIALNNLVKFDPPSTAINSPVGIPTASDPNNINSGFVLQPVRKDANDATVWHARAAFLWKPTDRFTVGISYYRQHDSVSNPQEIFPGFAGGVTDNQPAASNPFSPNAAGPVNYPTGGTVFRPDSEYSLPTLTQQPTSRTTDLASLELEADLGFATLSSSSSYYNDKQEPILDASAGIAQAYGSFYGFIPRLVDVDYTRNHLKGAVEELRLVSKGTNKLDYVVGGFYQNVKTNDWTTQYVPGQTYFDSISVGFSANPQIGDINFITHNETSFNDRAIFGELTYHITDRWQFTGGGRQFWQGFSVNTFSELPYCGIFCGDNAAGDTIVNGASAVNNHIFKLNSSFEFAPHQMVYGTFSEGFRRGGANGIPLSGPFAASPSLLLYQPDETKNYELGIKGRALGQTYSLAAYWIKWDNVQINGNSAAGGYGLVANGSRARSRGIEFELSGMPAPGLTYSLNYAYTDAQIDSSFQVVDDYFGTATPIISTQKGDVLPNSPKNSASLTLGYEQLLSNSGWGLQYHLNGSYRSAAQSSLLSLIPGNPEPFKIAGFSVWNASVTLHSERNYSAMLYMNNILDARAITGGVQGERQGPRGDYYFVGRPRTLGLQLTYSFGGKH